MTIERLLQINMALLAFMGTLLLGIGQHNARLPLLVGAAAVAAVIFTDVLGWLRLHRHLANIGMVLAAVISLRNFMPSGSESQLISIARLLTYVQIIMLFQHKNYRIYGHLAVFSLLQVVVGALLRGGVEFGVGLFAYAIVAFFALTLFFLYRQVLRFEHPGTAGQRGGSASAKAGTAQTVVANSEPMWQQLLGKAPDAQFEMQADSIGKSSLHWGLVRQIAALSLAALSFAIVFFFSIPRYERTNWNQPRFANRRLTGFSKEVSFDQMGEILRSDRLAFRATFSRPVVTQQSGEQRSGEQQSGEQQSGEQQSSEQQSSGPGAGPQAAGNSTADQQTRFVPFAVFGEPYFPGAYLTDYDSDRVKAVWRAGQVSNRGPAPLQKPPVNERLIRVDVTVQVFGDSTIFAQRPAFRTPQTPRDMLLDPNDFRIFRQVGRAGAKDSQYDYSYFTTAFRADVQQQFQPVLFDDSDTADLQRFRQHLGLARDFNATQFVKLSQLAQRLVQGVGNNRVQQVRQLEGFFQQPDLFRYSLKPADVDDKRDYSRDPIEDFLINHRTGHCEYYASALTMMLRSQRIPARLVVGYKGGELNSVGRYYRVRQSDAHAWVEAFLPYSDCPEVLQKQYGSKMHGAWIRLDPTPEGDRDLNQEPGVADRIDDSLDYAQHLWESYVVGLDNSRQEEIYNFQTDRRPKMLPQFARWARGNLGVDLTGVLQGNWFNGRAFLVVFVLGVAGVLGTRAGRNAWKRLMVWMGLSWGSRGGRRRNESQVAFYQRLERMLETTGLHRRPAETAREFAVVAERYLADDPHTRHVADMPQTIVRHFYNVRFGCLPLADAARQHVEQCLTQLDAAIAARLHDHSNDGGPPGTVQQ